MTSRQTDALTPEERALAARLAVGDLPSPPAVLDAAILAAARDAVAPDATVAPPADGAVAPPQPRVASRPYSRRRWPFGVGIAASLLVAVGIAWQLRPLDERDNGVVSEMPAAAPQVRRVAPSAASAGATPEAAPGTTDMPAASRERAAPAAAGPSPDAVAPDAADTRPENARLAESAAPVSAAQVDPAAVVATPEDADAEDGGADTQSLPLPPSQTTALGNRVVVAPATRPAPPAPAAAPAPALERSAELRTSSTARPQAARRDTPRLERLHDAAGAEGDGIDDHAFQPDHDEPPASADSPEFRTAWLARVRELLDDGDIDAARASLTEFHRRHPQAELPADLRALIE